MKLDLFKKVLKDFNVRDMKAVCNYKDCKESPSKEIIIYKYDYKKGREDLANLFVCKEHINSVNDLVKKLKKENQDIVIDKEVKEL